MKKYTYTGTPLSSSQHMFASNKYLVLTIHASFCLIRLNYSIKQTKRTTKACNKANSSILLFFLIYKVIFTIYLKVVKFI